MKRSFDKFTRKLRAASLYSELEKLALSGHVSLRDLYDGDASPSIISTRRAVYLWLLKEKKSVNEIARLFDRAPSGVLKLVGESKLVQRKAARR